MFYFVYDVPTTTLAIWITLLFVGFCWSGCIIVRPFLRLFVPPRAGKNDIVGYVISCFGVFYGLLLGLIAVAAYQNYVEVEANVDAEVASLGALYQDVSGYREPYGQNLQWLLRDYCRYVIKYGWPEYRKGRLTTGEETRIEAFHERLLEFRPETDGEKILHAEVIRQFNNFMEQHRTRERSVATGIPALMWYVVWVGAMLQIALVWLFDMDLLSHLVLGGILAFFLGTVILLIVAMDNPFRGEVSISPASFESLYWTKLRV